MSFSQTGKRGCHTRCEHSDGFLLWLSQLIALFIMHSPGFSAPGTSHYAFIRILSSWHLSLYIHQDSLLLALLIMHSSEFSAPGTSHHAFIRILGSQHFSLCIHQESTGCVLIQSVRLCFMSKKLFLCGQLGELEKITVTLCTARQRLDVYELKACNQM